MSRIPLKYCKACGGKRLYRYEEQARDGMARILRDRSRKRKDDFAMHVYRCPHKIGWHFGHDYETVKRIKAHCEGPLVSR
jgi:hypothetical protein